MKAATGAVEIWAEMRTVENKGSLNEVGWIEYYQWPPQGSCHSYASSAAEAASITTIPCKSQVAIASSFDLILRLIDYPRVCTQ